MASSSEAMREEGCPTLIFGLTGPAGKDARAVRSKAPPVQASFQARVYLAAHRSLAVRAMQAAADIAEKRSPASPRVCFWRCRDLIFCRRAEIAPSRYDVAKLVAHSRARSQILFQ